MTVALRLGRNLLGAALVLALRTRSSHAFSPAAAVPSIFSESRSMSSSSSSTSLDMVRNRGLERREEGATPLPGGMTLYIKPAADGTSVGDCPFAHFVRIVLAEKGLEYDVLPTSPENKPQWLLEDYGGKMPALRHRRECYVDSEVIAQYLDFFFKEPELGGGAEETAAASEAIDGFFPAMAKYTKSPEGDEEGEEKKAALEAKLLALEEHLGGEGRTGPYLVGDGTQFTLLDCNMAPKLYAMEICLREIKGGAVHPANYPNVRKYMDSLFERPSFQSTCEYGPETVVWGWTSH